MQVRFLTTESGKLRIHPQLYADGRLANRVILCVWLSLKAETRLWLQPIGFGSLDGPGQPPMASAPPICPIQFKSRKQAQIGFRCSLPWHGRYRHGLESRESVILSLVGGVAGVDIDCFKRS